MTRSTRFTVCSDSHGTEIDQVASAALLDFISDFKPQIRIHLGDIWNLDSLRKGASEEDKAKSLDDDFEAGEDFLSKYYKNSRNNVALLGNHDARLYDLANSTLGVFRDYAKEKIAKIEKTFKRHRATVLPYDARLGVYKLGKLNCIHGYYAGKNAAANHAKTYGNSIFGHVHAIDQASIEGIDEPVTSRCIGAMCQIDMPYNARQPNKLRHRNGWAYGYVYPDGSYTLFQAYRVGNRFTAATSFKDY